VSVARIMGSGEPRLAASGVRSMAGMEPEPSRPACAWPPPFGGGREADADLFVPAPNNFAVGFETVELDEQLQAIGDIDRTFDTQVCPGRRQIPNRAGEGGIAVVERNDPRLQDTAPRPPTPFFLCLGGRLGVDWWVRR
jgi:hypothetical protein